MSTYQGERYVVEQLRSILQQLPPRAQILVRDDGSTDGTVAVIESLQDPCITVIRGANIGFGHSFLTLLNQAPEDADLVMFSDQDDVWLPNKIDRAWAHLAPLGDRPALYGSAQMLADADLRPLHPTAPWPRGPSLTGALTENIITGCTAAINRQALELLQRAGVPAGVRFHDWWLYLVVSVFGTVVYDDQPTLLYRQHGGNQIGHGAGWLGRQRQIIRFLLRNDWVGILAAQVGALLALYGPVLPPAARKLVLDHFSMRGSRIVPHWRLILSTRRWRHHAHAEMAFRLLVTLHRLHLWPLPGHRL